jgi:hypothetical protein
VLRGSLAARDGKLKEAEAILGSAGQKGGSLEMQMMQAQLAIQSSNLDQVPFPATSPKPPTSPAIYVVVHLWFVCFSKSWLAGVVWLHRVGLVTLPPDCSPVRSILAFQS